MLVKFFIMCVQYFIRIRIRIRIRFFTSAGSGSVEFRPGSATLQVGGIVPIFRFDVLIIIGTFMAYMQCFGSVIIFTDPDPGGKGKRFIFFRVFF